MWNANRRVNNDNNYTTYTSYDIVSCIVEFSAMILFALLHSVCGLKASQMNVQHGLIQELWLNKFELDRSNQKICRVKDDLFGLDSLFNDISTFVVYLMPKPSL